MSNTNKKMNKVLLEKSVLIDKINGLSDKEIGEKYNINLKKIEQIITKEKGINVSNINSPKKIRKFSPKDFQLEINTVWSFKSRGNWATHNGNYRGNWSPFIPRNIILRYSKENDLVLDYFCGSGTTAVECKLLNRNFIGIDINEKAIELAKENLNFEYLFGGKVDLRVADARNLSFLEDSSVDLICSHPPYSNIINYTYDNEHDLSHLDTENFLNEIKKVADESYRVLKDEKFCAILIGDMRKNKFVVPLGFWTIEKYLQAGFKIKEIIIKRQHNCKTTGFWYNNSIKYNFLLLAHEYLVVFQKTDRMDSFDEEKNIADLSFSVIDDIYLESTSVWIVNSSSYLDNAISNLVKRYSNNFCIYNINFNKTANLVIYLLDNKFDEFINDIQQINNNCIVAILCNDNRLINGLVRSEPIFVEQKLRNNKHLKIKEIIILSLDTINEMGSPENLNINHKYLLIYQKVK